MAPSRSSGLPKARPKSPEPEKQEAEKIEIDKGDSKKTYFKSLLREKQEGSKHQDAEGPKQPLLQDDLEECANKEMVRVTFSLRSLLDFKHMMREHGDLQLPDPKKNDRRCRKRPNYSNSKRAFFAKGRPPSTQEFLACSFSLFIFVFCGHVACEYEMISKNIQNVM